jgi:hypothetical protein
VVEEAESNTMMGAMKGVEMRWMEMSIMVRYEVSNVSKVVNGRLVVEMVMKVGMVVEIVMKVGMVVDGDGERGC